MSVCGMSKVKVRPSLFLTLLLSFVFGRCGQSGGDVGIAGEYEHLGGV